MLNPLHSLTASPAGRLRRFLLGGAFLAMAFASCWSAQAAPEGSGTIAGRVLNKGTGAYLAGAEVRLPDNRSVYTDGTGSFVVDGVSAGDAKVAVSYPGLDAQTVTFHVAAGQRTTEEIGLSNAEYEKSSVVKLSEFVVAGEKEGRAAALTEQKRAENMVNAISSDEFPNVAGGSVGDFLRNIPGVVIDYSGADPRAIRVRGFDPNLNAVSVDGMRAANAASGNTNRQFEIDQISLQNVETVEVTKSNRPDQEADTGGGSVNLVSKSAFSLKGQRISYTAMINGNSQDWAPLRKTPGPNEGKNESYKWYPGFSFAYMNSYLDNRVGVAVTANDYTFYSGQPATSLNWATVPSAFNLPREDPRGVYLASFGASESLVYTKRKSLSANLDFRLGTNTTAFIRNQVNTSYIRAWGRGLTLNAPAPSTNTATTTNVTLPGYSDTSEVAAGDINGTTITALNSASGSFAQDSSGDLLNKKGVGTDFAAGLKHRLGAWTIDYQAGASLSTNHYHIGAPGQGEPFGRADFYLRGITYRIDTPPGSHTPTVTQTGGPSIYDLNNYVSGSQTTNLTTNTKMGSFTVSDAREVNATDRFYSGRANIKRDFGSPYLAYIQTGAAWREQRRNIDFGHRRRWFYVGPDGVAGTADDTANLGQFVDTNVYRRPYGLSYPVPSLTKITEYYKANPQAFLEDTYWNIQQEGQNLRMISEFVSAAYLEGSLRFRRLSVLAGVRVERTRDHGDGPITNNNAAVGITDRLQQARAIYWSQRADSNSAYSNWFPSVQGKYTITPNLLARAGFTQSIGRQNFGNIIPGVTVNATNPVLNVNNPGLLPQIYYNQDYSLEYYLNPTGILSVGYFYKEIKNYTRSFDTVILPGVDYGVGIDTDSYANGTNTLRRLLNVGNAYVKGWEFNYTQQLDRLSRWLHGVSVFANYTTLNSHGNYGAATNSTLPLDNFVPHTFNTGVSYRYRAFGGSVKYNYKSHYPTSASAASYNYDRGTYDVSLSWDLRRSVTLFAEAKNITNRQRDSYRVLPTRVIGYTNDGSIINFGVKGTF